MMDLSRARVRALSHVFGPLSVALALACVGGAEDDSEADTQAENDAATDESSCTPGALGCACVEGECHGPLECVAGLCAESDESSEAESSTEESGSSTEGEGSSTEGSSGTSGESTEESSDSTSTEGTGTESTETEGECPSFNQVMCEGECIDVLVNSDNCGDCGIECTISGQSGFCQDGECSPVWSNCIASDEGLGMTCDEICGLSGETCVDQGCGGETILLTQTLNGCQFGNAATYANFDCDGVFGYGGLSYAACCCTQ